MVTHPLQYADTGLVCALVLIASFKVLKFSHKITILT